MMILDAAGELRNVPTPADPFAPAPQPVVIVDQPRGALEDLSSLLGVISSIALLMG